MNKQELMEILDIDTGDKEEDHINADNALLEYIDDEEITEAFNKINKWYA